MSIDTDNIYKNIFDSKYRFISDDFKDILLSSGLDVNYKNQVPHRLQGEAAAKALEELKDSYEKYKSDLKFKSYRFLRTVEGQMGLIENGLTPTEARQAISKKLSAMSTKRLDKEKQYNFIHLFFHKIAQMICRHGFRTKGTWEADLAKKISQVDLVQIKDLVSLCIISEAPYSRDSLLLLKDKINNLSTDQFTQLVRESVLTDYRRDACFINTKFEFYKNLNEDKKALFLNELYMNYDSLGQAIDIAQGIEDDEMKEFAGRLDLDRMGILDLTDNLNGWERRLKQMLAERMISNFVAKKDYVSIGDMQWHHILFLNNILEKPLLLTADEVAAVRNNVRVMP